MAAALLASLCWPQAAEAAALPPRIAEIVQVTEISGLSASPDGRFVAFRTERARIEPNDYALRWHVNISEDKIEVTTVLLDQRAHDMRDIQSIRLLGVEGEYLITFSDQTNINTTYLKPVTLEMIALLSAKSGKRVIR